MNIKKAYRSTFIVDVQISDTEIRLQDSGRNFFYIKLSDKTACDSFKQWLKNVFLKGVAQTVSIFEYTVEKRDEGEVGMYIVKFLTPMV